MLNYCLMSLQGIKRKKMRSISVILIVSFVVFLINSYVFMSETVFDAEAAKSVDNIEYRKIVLYPWDEDDDTPFCLYKLDFLKGLPHVESVYLDGFYLSDEWIPTQTISSFSINGLVFKRMITTGTIVDGQGNNISNYGELNVELIYDGFDAVNIAEEKWVQKRIQDYTGLLFGEWPKNDGIDEIAIDSVMAKRIFQYENDCDLALIIGEKASFAVKNGEKVDCIISGIYDYRLKFGYNLSGNEEDVKRHNAYLKKRYTKEEIAKKNFYFAEWQCPVYVNESLAEKIYVSDSDIISSRFGVFENYYGPINVVADSIDNVSEIVKVIEEKGYTASSELDAAEHAKDRFFFFRDILLYSGVAIGVICVLQLVSVMIMIINERKSYMHMLSNIGYKKALISDIISGEVVWLGIIGAASGLVLCLGASVLLKHLVEESFSENGLYSYITIEINPISMIVTLAGIGIVCYSVGKICSYFAFLRKS